MITVLHYSSFCFISKFIGHVMKWMKANFFLFFSLDMKFLASLYPIYICLKPVYRCRKSLGRGKEWRVSEQIKFITMFTSNSFQVLVDTGPFLKGCLTKGPWRVEGIRATENFQVGIMTECHRMRSLQGSFTCSREYLLKVSGTNFQRVSNSYFLKDEH